MLQSCNLLILNRRLLPRRDDEQLTELRKPRAYPRTTQSHAQIAHADASVSNHVHVGTIQRIYDRLSLRNMMINSDLTALTAGGRSDAEMATPTSEPVLPPSKDKATPAPDGTAINTPTHRLRNWPLRTKT